MGMFNYISNELYCPFCGTKQKANDFQTKTFVGMMVPIDIFKDLNKDENPEIYTNCIKCKNWIHLLIQGFSLKKVDEE